MTAAHQRIPQNLRAKWNHEDDVVEGFAQNPGSWLETKALEFGLKYLLAHAVDGVIWGLIDGKALALSGDAAPTISPPLRAETLQECRLFSESGELFLWRTHGGWQARYVTDEKSSEVFALDENYVLWGDHIDFNIRCNDRRFTVVADGAQGLHHAVPLRLNKSDFSSQKHPLHLTARHYLQKQRGENGKDTGQLLIAFSRLVRLEGGRS